MARLNDDAQWIVLMGFLVSFSLFFLAMIINQSTLVGQTTAESVLDFPKDDIRDVKSVITGSVLLYSSNKISTDQYNILQDDITNISLSRKAAVVWFSPYGDIQKQSGTDHHTRNLTIHYNNGVTEYTEYWTSP